MIKYNFLFVLWWFNFHLLLKAVSLLEESTIVTQNSTEIALPPEKEEESRNKFIWKEFPEDSQSKRKLASSLSSDEINYLAQNGLSELSKEYQLLTGKTNVFTGFVMEILNESPFPVINIKVKFADNEERAIPNLPLRIAPKERDILAIAPKSGPTRCMISLSFGGIFGNMQIQYHSRMSPMSTYHVFTTQWSNQTIEEAYASSLHKKFFPWTSDLEGLGIQGGSIKFSLEGWTSHTLQTPHGLINVDLYFSPTPISHSLLRISNLNSPSAFNTGKWIFRLNETSEWTFSPDPLSGLVFSTKGVPKTIKIIEKDPQRRLYALAISLPPTYNNNAEGFVSVRPNRQIFLRRDISSHADLTWNELFSFRSCIGNNQIGYELYREDMTLMRGKENPEIVSDTNVFKMVKTYQPCQDMFFIEAAK